MPLKSLTFAAGLVLLAPAAAAETVTLRTVDFELPDGIAEQIPRGVRAEDIFVSDSFCFYVRSQLSFVFIGCVG